ncbi:MAG: hypothetical protein NTZ68_00605 [Candidatus Dependentiae bacterium]|nr:hypothetical protein [Candidatus Dependentiae bacterium]
MKFQKLYLGLLLAAMPAPMPAPSQRPGTAAVPPASAPAQVMPAVTITVVKGNVTIPNLKFTLNTYDNAYSPLSEIPVTFGQPITLPGKPSYFNITSNFVSTVHNYVSANPGSVPSKDTTYALSVIKQTFLGGVIADITLTPVTQAVITVSPAKVTAPISVPVAPKPAPSTPAQAAPSVAAPMAAKTAAQAPNAQLIKILQADNVTNLQAFIKANTKFDWVSLRTSGAMQGMTPLMQAASSGAINCIRYLLTNNTGNIKSSINTQATGSNTVTAWDCAQSSGATSVQTLLCKNGGTSGMGQPVSC